MTAIGEQETARGRVSRLFQFVRSLNQLRNPIQRQIRELSWTLSLADLPQHPCVALGAPPSPATDGEPKAEDDASNFVLRVGRPTLEPVPKPPEQIAEWLENGWERYDGTVSVVESRYRNDSEDPTVARFDDDPSRVEALTIWTAVRTAFIETQRPAVQALRLFERLYELRGILERDAERYEIILADGILCWNVPSGSIRFPIILQRLELDFDARVPRFTLTDANTATELNSVLFRTVSAIDGSIISTLKAELVAGQYHPLTQDPLTAFLKSVPPRLAAAGRFVEKAPDTDTAEPTVYRAPLIFLRRRTFGFAEALDKIIEDIENDADLPKSLVNIVGLGDLNADFDIVQGSELGRSSGSGESTEVLFTKAANEEQYRIAETLSRHSCVIVQGPPGTGKTHTIANMIGHLLAQGKSVLVTSATTKALRVLRDKVVPKLKSLCVSVLESDAQGNDQLKASIDSIVERMSTSTEANLQVAVDFYSKEHAEALADLERTRLRLLDARFADSQPVVVAGQGIPAIKAAKIVAAGQDRDSWIPGPVVSGCALTLTKEEVRASYRTNGTVPPSIEKELSQRLPDPATLPSPRAFEKMVEDWSASADSESSYDEYWSDNEIDSELLQSLLASVAEVAREWMGAEDWLFSVGSDGYRGGGHSEVWANLIAEMENVEELSEHSRDTFVRLGPQLSDQLEIEQQRQLLEEIIQHLEAGGNLGKLTLFTRSRWKDVIGKVSVNGRSPKAIDEFRALHALACLNLARAALHIRWMRQVVAIGGPTLPMQDPENMAGALLRKARWALHWYSDAFVPFREDIEAAGFLWSEAKRLIPTGLKPTDEFEGLVRLCAGVLPAALQARVAALRHAACEEELAELASTIQSFGGDTVDRLNDAVVAKSATDYERAYRDLVQLVDLTRELGLRRDLLSRLSTVAPAWAEALSRRLPPHDATSEPGGIDDAWLWRQLSQQLEERDNACVEDLDRELQDRTRTLQEVTAALADSKAWLAQRRRTGLAQQQALIGYQLAVKKIGKGLGKRVPVLRKQARELMDQAKTAVPVWIMPLIRVAENYDPRTTKFDVVIIDEASQSDVTGLIALYYGRQVLVVGDDEQVSPDAVGQNSTETQYLIDEHLYGVPNAQLYDGRASIYDVAKQAFGGTILLREHFRCVPEIIGFSNHYSYNDKMVLLRESSESNLLPHVVAHRVAGSSTDKVNPIEAEEIVALIMACIEQPEYAGKTFGVISLVGEDQARTIETLLRTRIEPRVLEERRLLCGNSAQFQGDERDVIFLSMVDGPKGRPLPTNDDPKFKKRFNVAASRARDQMWVVFSLDPTTDLRSGDLRRRLIEYALDPMALSTRIAIEQRKADSDFERDVLRRLITCGYRATSQYQIGSYEIDILVEGAGRRRLAVECDGERYHTMLELEHDLERQSLLERVGLTFHRIRGAKYYRDPDLEIIRLVDHLTSMDIMPMPVEPAAESSASEHELRARVLAYATQLREDLSETHGYVYYRRADKSKTDEDSGAVADKEVDRSGADTPPRDASAARSAELIRRNGATANIGRLDEDQLPPKGPTSVRHADPSLEGVALVIEQPPFALEPESFKPVALVSSNGPSHRGGEDVRMDPINESLHLRKETKGTFCFESDDADAHVPTIYIRKSAFPDGKAPKTIRIVVERQ